MSEIICKLPEDITNRIIPYTYSIQPKHLLLDIKNYSKTLTQAKQLYQKYYTPYNKKKGLFWDLWNFSNFDYVNFDYKFYSIWFRFHTFKNIQNLIFFLSEKYMLMDISTRINILWGIMLPEERMAFIKRKHKYLLKYLYEYTPHPGPRFPIGWVPPFHLNKLSKTYFYGMAGR